MHINYFSALLKVFYGSISLGYEKKKKSISDLLPDAIWIATQ